MVGSVNIKEFEKKEEEFGAVFFNDLVAKMLLFRAADYAIPRSDWYREEKGLKAEVVTYTLALLRFSLQKNKKDINLERIYKKQAVSKPLIDYIVELGKFVRDKITDPTFRGGIANPSEFCKSEKGWLKFQELEIDLSSLDPQDLLTHSQLEEVKEKKIELHKTSKIITDLEYVMEVSSNEWLAISNFYTEKYDAMHMSARIPIKCAGLIQKGKMLTDKQLKMAVLIRNQAYVEGFDYVA